MIFLYLIVVGCVAVEKRSRLPEEQLPFRKRLVLAANRQERDFFPVDDAAARAVYSSDDFMHFEDSLRQILRSPPSAELWDSLVEIVPVSVFPEGEIHFDADPLGESKYSTVYEIENHIEWVIKYHSFCLSVLEPVDATLREAYFLELINFRNPSITHKIKYLSSELVPGFHSEIKSPLTQNVCPRDPLHGPPSVRYIITERVGQSLWEYVGLTDTMKAPFEDAIFYGVQMISLLQQLHALNVIHGDIHAGNLAFRDSPEESNRLILIDFGRARIDAPLPGRVSSPSSVSSETSHTRILCHGHMSLWESVTWASDHYLSSFRDDTYRVLMVLAMLIHGPAHTTVQMRMCHGNGQGKYAQYIAFKETANIFDTEVVATNPGGLSVTYRFDLANVIPETLLTKKNIVSGILLECLTHVRGLDYRQSPDYEYLMHLLNGILDL